MGFKYYFGKLVPQLQEKIALKSPQLKILYPDLDIKDIRNYGYTFVWDNRNMTEVNIEGRNYIVYEDMLYKMLDLLDREECREMKVGEKLVEEIMGCYEKIVEDRELFERAMENLMFRYVYMNRESICNKFLNEKYGMVSLMVLYMYG